MPPPARLTPLRLALAAVVVIAALRLVAADVDRRPNVLLILADDLGWSDLGCYGGEIHTPHLDALARRGLRFTQFYNSSRCCPSRASILTGLHPAQAGFPEFFGTLPPTCVTIPEVLQDAGYRTFMVGKWHLNEKTKPTERGFEEFYGMLGGYNTCWKEDPHYTRWPADRPKRPYAPGAFYSTDVFADYAIDFLAQARGPAEGAARPWFLYLAFNAPHFPLHAPAETIAKYEQMYAQGWDSIREARLARQKKQLGIVPPDLALPPRGNTPRNRFNDQTGWADKEIPAWDSLPADRRADLARRMAVYAAMVDHLDQAVGRVVAFLKQTGQFENTLILFLSDNGGCAEWDPWGFDTSSGPTNVLHGDESLAQVGGPDSYISYGSGWANASNTPLRLFKHYMHEGGIRTPLIVHWPAGVKAAAGSLCKTPGYITDLMPTICAATAAAYPKERNGAAIMPVEGASLLPTLTGESLPPRQLCIEHEGHRTIRDGDWKLVRIKGHDWELYDLAEDPTESWDRAAECPDRVTALVTAWERWARRTGAKQ
jgi:arylsulfatase A-like enzyme